MRLEIVDAKEQRPTADEIRDIVEIELHPKVKEWLTIYVDSNPRRAIHSYRRFFKRLPKSGKVDVLLAKRGGKVVGFLALWRLGRYMRHVASVGISVHPDYWGKGVATRLMKTAIVHAKKDGVSRLEIETLSKNAGMRCLAKKAGFKLERIRKKRIFKDGKYHDEATYYMLL